MKELSLKSMQRREAAVHGPRQAEPDDIHALNDVFADAFTDRYRRDGMVGVRVPKLNPDVWHYALADAGPGAMLWCDQDDRIVAFNIAHASGGEGWMGPLAVRTDRQGAGLGQEIVLSAVSWLKQQEVTTLGLETMPRTVDNIGFYSQLGFLPGHLTVTVVGDVNRNGPAAITRLSELPSADRDSMIEACRVRLGESAPGYDFTKELRLTHEQGIGDTIVVASNVIHGFALWHSAPLVEGRPAEELRVLKLFADSRHTLGQLLAGLEECARQTGLPRIAIRCQTAFGQAYALLMRQGYRVRWTDLRMTLDQFPSAGVQSGEVLFSNWEI